MARFEAPQETRRYSSFPLWFRSIFYTFAIFAIAPLGIYLAIKDPEFTWGRFFLALLWVFIFLVVVGLIGGTLSGAVKW